MRWHGQERGGSDVNVDDLVAVLRPTAWRLFSSAPESNRFPDGAVVDAIKAAERSAQMTLRPTEIREVLDRCGLIFDSGREDGETQYSFCHKTFVEYLAAEHLCRVLREYGWDIVEERTVVFAGRVGGLVVLAFGESGQESPRTD